MKRDLFSGADTTNLDEFLSTVKGVDKRNISQNISDLNVDYTLTSAVFDILGKQGNDKDSITFALENIAVHYGASRCFIVESLDDGISYQFTHEWCSYNTLSNIDDDPFISTDLIEAYLRSTPPGGIYACQDIGNCLLDDILQKSMLEKNTKSFLHAQIKKDNVISFFIGLEDCEKKRAWTDIEINTMNYMSKLFSIILQEKHLQDEIKSLNEYNKVSAFIADNTDNFIYIVDPDTYDIIHMNQKALTMYNNPSESVWRSKKCYELLHDKTEPCEFCTNKYTTEHKFYEWNYYNPIFNKTYLFKDKLVHLNGKLVKFQVATDITTLVSLETELKDKLEEQTLLLNCIKMLHSSETHDVSIKTLLSFVCEFFDASRGVIIQISEDGLASSNTHEWTDEHTAPRRDVLQNIPNSVMQPLFDKFIDKSALYFHDISKDFSNNKPINSILQEQGISTLMVTPIFDTSGKFIGMLGIDNPKQNVDRYWLLDSLSVFVSDFLGKNKLVDSLNQLSYYDTLTGTKNRHSYRMALREIDDGDVSSLGVAYVDISGLSRINEEKGTRYGDSLIIRMSQILSEIFDDNFFRVGGDEFVVLEKNTAELDFEDKVGQLKNIIYKEPDLNASIGFTWNTNYTDDSSGDEYSTVRDNISYTAMLSRNLDNELRRGKYVVYLQPQINFETNMLDGAEALIRKIDASGNIQSPASFVPFYEKEGMISKIDLFVFETVCKLLSSRKQKGISTDMKFSINCSRSTIMEKNIVARLSEICERYSIHKSMFVIEITETITHADDKVFSYIISSLKDAGFCVSLDDFGTGQSNLSSLKISDFDEIKIDMSLTKDVHLDKKSKILTKVALNLCDEFPGMISVAEGIETVEQFDILKSMGCHKAQGYYLSKPISIPDFEHKYFSSMS